MGIKMLMTEACLVIETGGEGGAVHADIGDTREVSKEDALYLARLGRAYYADKADDPTKGQFTAGAEEKARVKRLAADVETERQARVKATVPPVNAADIGAIVAAAVAQALAAQKQPA